MVRPSSRIGLAFHGNPGRIDRLRQAQGQREKLRGHLRLPPDPGERHAPEHQSVEEGHLCLRHPDFHLRIPPHQLLLQGLIQPPFHRLPGKKRFLRRHQSLVFFVDTKIAIFPRPDNLRRQPGAPQVPVEGFWGVSMCAN